jgi:DNA end-binding protein Ku
VARPIWKGHISFGLVNIPVTLATGDRRDELSFELLDDRDLSPVGYRKINKTTDAEVPLDHLARGFRLDDGRVVLVTEEDLRKASPERTQTLEIRSFLAADEVPPRYFVRPYYLEPTAAGEKGYVLLRDAMKAARKAAIGLVVLRARQHLALMTPEGPWLLMVTMRYANEFRDPKDLAAPKKTPEALGIREKESQLASRLIEEMTEPWKPEQYHDQYREDLLGSIERRAAAGQVRSVRAAGTVGREGNVINIMSLLKRSVEQKSGPRSRRGRTA